jgi:hypothetical protein
MEKMIGIILIAAGVWVGVEYFTEGDQMFGGIFASEESASSASSDDADEAAAAPREHDWAGSRVKQSVTKMHTDRAQRIKERLGSD